MWTLPVYVKLLSIHSVESRHCLRICESHLADARFFFYCFMSAPLVMLMMMMMMGFIDTFAWARVATLLNKFVVRIRVGLLIVSIICVYRFFWWSYYSRKRTVPFFYDIQYNAVYAYIYSSSFFITAKISHAIQSRSWAAIKSDELQDQAGYNERDESSYYPSSAKSNSNPKSRKSFRKRKHQ